MPSNFPSTGKFHGTPFLPSHVSLGHVACGGLDTLAVRSVGGRIRSMRDSHDGDPRCRRPEYAWSEDAEDWTLAFAQQLFLEEVDRQSPDTRRQLRADVLPHYQRALDDIEEVAASGKLPAGDFRPPKPGEVDWFDITTTAAPFAWFRDAERRSDPAVDSLCAALDEWLIRWNLDGNWVRDSALRTLYASIIDSSIDEWVAFNPIWPGVLNTEEESFDFHSRWEPTNESEANARARIEGEFKRSLASFLNASKAIASQRGLKRTPTPREEDRDRRWLVSYQVVELSVENIAATDDTAVAAEAVRKAIGRLAGRLGITPREGRRGPSRD